MAMAARLRSSFGLIRSNILRASLLPHTSSSPIANIPNSQSRDFSAASSSKEAKVKVPLTLFGFTGNYATALFLAASRSNMLDKVEAELLDVVEASKKSPNFSLLIKDMSIRREAKVKVIREVFSESSCSELTKNLLALMAENGRLKHIESVANKFMELTMAHRGEVKAIVTTVIPLPPDEEKELKATLQEILHCKAVKLEQKVDPSILGGIVVEFGQKLFDFSIRTRAMEFERFLRDPANFEMI